MKTYILICDYCNHTWTEVFFSKPDPDHIRCPVCKDKNIQLIKKVDYYANSKDD